MLDGAMVCSCLVLAAEAEGKTVQTIEGVAEGGALHPVQAKFLELGALQCGFCTPGFIVAAKALLEKHPDPSETEIRYWLAGNLCRCTGYDKIVRAVIEAACGAAAGPQDIAARAGPQTGPGVRSVRLHGSRRARCHRGRREAGQRLRG